MIDIDNPPPSQGESPHRSQEAATMVRRPLAVLIALSALVVGFLAGGIVGGASASDAVERNLEYLSQIEDLQDEIDELEDDA